MKYNDIVVRSGHIVYEDKDTTPMNEEKEKYMEFFTCYQNRMCFIGTSLTTLEYLVKNKEEAKIFSEYAPALFQTINHNFLEEIIVGLTAFYSWNDEYSFHEFFDHINDNFDKIFTADYYDHYIDDETNEEIENKHIKTSKEELKEAIEACKNNNKEEEELINKLKTIRCKVFAHYDKIDENITISLMELRKIYDITSQTINRVMVLYDRCERVFTLMNSDDISNICRVLQLHRDKKLSNNRKVNND